MALTRVVAAGIATGGDYEVVTLTTSGNIQVGSATTIHTSGFQIGSSNLHSTGLSIQNLNATGVITATSFVGDISQATGAAAGLGSALSQVQSNPLNKIYYTDTVLSIGSTQTVNPPDSSNIAYTQYAEIAVEEGYDLIVEDGDDLVPDILGLSTGTAAPLAGAGGRVRADNFTNKAGTGAPTFPNGVNVTGVATATTFSGNVTGDVTGNLTGSSINVTGVITATSFSGDGSNLTGIDATQIQTGNTSVQTVDTGSDGHVKVTTEGTERLAITSNGRLKIKSPSSSTGEQDGRIEWWNENDAGIMSKISVVREAISQAPSSLVFYTSADVNTPANNSEGDITERFRISSSGVFSKGGNQIYPILQVVNTGYITGGVDLSSTQTSYTDIKTFASFTPKKSGSLVYVMLQVQTWWGSQSDGNSTDVYARLQQNSSGSYATFYENNRLAGNFLYDERYHHDTKHLIGTFTTSSTNLTSLKLQAMYYASNNHNFNFFHSSLGSNCIIIEYDVS